MNQQTFQSLQFLEVKETIAGFALTKEAALRIRGQEPSFNRKQIEGWLKEVTEAVEILKKSASVPVHGLDGMEQLLSQLNKGTALRPEQLVKLIEFLDCCGKMRRYMKDKEFVAPVVSSYVYSIEELPDLNAELNRCIRNGAIDDYASKELLKIRKQISIQKDRLKEKVQNLIRSHKYKSYLQENVVSQRFGRYVIPIKKEYRHKIKGNVLDTSASGSTLFMEPEELSQFQDQLNWLLSDEEAEVQKILMFLTGLVEERQQQIKLAMDVMITYDQLFAKAKYSRLIDGKSVRITEDNGILLKEARHPLLGEKAVPLTLDLTGSNRALVITGPNTGGKTVAIKTVGLFALMAQCGMHLPVGDGSSMSIFHKVLVDIGDGQSIVENLSTFSSRIKNIKHILEDTNDQSLVLLDELGSGTDPAEGMGLATAILEQLYRKGAVLLATTHYSEIKEYANETEGFVNGAMEFDLETLKPTYRLIIGRGGESQAFAIALKLGIHPKIIERAHQITYKENKEYIWEMHHPNNNIEKQILFNKHHHAKKNTVKSISNEKIYEKGDNVIITATNEFGIVYEGPDEKGNYIVQVKSEKQTINHKRLKLYIEAKELYPPDYDFDIIFKTVKQRKLGKQLNKGHVEGLIIDHTEQ